MTENTIKNKAAVALGRRGGLVTSQNIEHMRKIGKKGSKSRWLNKNIKSNKK